MTKRPQRSVLVVDDDQALGTVLEAVLRQDGLDVRHVTSGSAALELLEKRPFELVVTDLRMPGMDGMTLLGRLQARWPDLPVVMLTAHGSVPLAVKAMKAGAREFVQKPFDREELLFVVHKALGSQPADQAASAPVLPGGDFIGESPAMADVFHLIEKAARTSANVLIQGESGTGKELVAQAIHAQSARGDGPLIKVHCGALPDSLIESELFGYEKGAFTGAVQRKPGRVELADGGTLFLDEIGDTSPMVQVKLLRVLQERTFERLGGTKTLSADVRFVAATHRDLQEMVNEEAFREDLFYRLNVIPIRLPPLRERGGDVALLARHFCRTIGDANGLHGAQLSVPASELVGAQAWPGNVRQLQNFIERLVVLSDQPLIDVTDVERELGRQAPAKAATTATTEAPLDEHRRRAEREALEQTLARCGNNRSQAARILGISRRTLYNKLAELGLN